jgi:hypothetical protein
VKTLGISVEGSTEREFVNRVLKSHLIKFGWTLVKPVSLGGGISIRRVRDELRQLAEQFNFVTTLYDLYGFAGRDERDADALEAAICEAVGGVPNLLAYVQRHEFEALIFADPLLVADHFRDRAGLKILQQALQLCGSPEDINHSYDNCPSRRLKRAFPTYDKVLHGAVLTEKMGLDTLRVTCPRFGRWLTTLEEQGQSPLPK